MTDVLDRVLGVVARQAAEWRAEAERIGSTVPRAHTAGDLHMMASAADALFMKIKGMGAEPCGVLCMPFQAPCEFPEICRGLGGCRRSLQRLEAAKAARDAGPPSA